MGKVKMYEGAWGVTRGGELGEVWRPGFYWAFRGEPTQLRFLRDEKGRVWTFRKDANDIIATFPTREAAEAWRDRKPWHKSRKAWGIGLTVAAAILAAIILLGCDPATGPEVEQGCLTGEWGDSLRACGGVK